MKKSLLDSLRLERALRGEPIDGVTPEDLALIRGRLMTLRTCLRDPRLSEAQRRQIVAKIAELEADEALLSGRSNEHNGKACDESPCRNPTAGEPAGPGVSGSLVVDCAPGPDSPSTTNRCVCPLLTAPGFWAPEWWVVALGLVLIASAAWINRRRVNRERNLAQIDRHLGGGRGR